MRKVKEPDMTDQTAIPLTFASELKELVIAVIHEPDDHLLA